MTEQSRGRTVSIWGLTFQTVFAAILLAIWLWVGVPAALPAAVFVASGVLLWLVVAMMFYIRHLAEQERIELEQLTSRGTPESTIFAGAAAGESLRSARRADFFERWIIPVFTLLWSGMQVAAGILLLRYVASVGQPSPAGNIPAAVIFLIIAGFLSFLLSRYCTGMGRQSEWRPLRSAASYTLASVLVAVLAGLALGAVLLNKPAAANYFAWPIPLVQLILAAELLINFIVDIYRPRIPGHERYLPFDSRLLGLVAEPTRIGSSVADALNYQFGFEVSRTWFYQLLSRALVPLLIFGVAVLFAMSCIVLVDQGQQAVVMHWGKPSPEPMGPGIHLKWPWPVDTVQHFDVQSIHLIELGTGEARERKTDKEFAGKTELWLWTIEHGAVQERDFYIAVPPEQVERYSGSGEKSAPPVNIIKLVVDVQYRVSDVYKYGFKYQDTDKMLLAAAYRELTRYGASATLTDPIGPGQLDRPEAIMTFGRDRAEQQLLQRIQQAVGPKGLDLGVEITAVNLVAVHPPSTAADAYEAVLKAERAQEQQRYEAQAAANSTLAEAAGDPFTALTLALAVRRLEQFQALQAAAGSPDLFQSTVGEYIDATTKQIGDLDKEIAQEKLQGRGGKNDALTNTQRIRSLYADHLGNLQALAQQQRSGSPIKLDEAVQQAAATADELLGSSQGLAAAHLAQARSYRWRTEMAERARATEFAGQLQAYNANPQMYKLDRWLDVWDEVLPDMMKYVLGIDRNKINLWLNVEQSVESIESTLVGSSGDNQTAK